MRKSASPLLAIAVFLLAPALGCASLLLPTSSLSCTRGAYEEGIVDCTAVAAVAQLADNGDGIQGIKDYLTSGPESYTYAYIDSFSTSFTPSLSFTTFGPLYGTVNGHTCTELDNSGCGFLALAHGSDLELSYQFTLGESGATVDTWKVILFAAGTTTAEIDGVGAGTFSGSRTVTTATDWTLGNPSTFILSVSVVASVPLGGSGTVTIDVPSHSLDFGGPLAVPEPGTIWIAPLLAALALRYRRDRRRPQA